jgi:DNA-binding response OmpR family regulator
VTPRLLVLDDDTSILALLRSYFAGMGWSVETCAEASRGLSHIDGHPFDAVICDLHFGAGRQSEGLGVVAHARAKLPAAAVLLFTAAAGEGVRAAALQAGADEVIAKPAPLARLRDAALGAIRRKR